MLPNREICKNIFQLVAEDPTIIGKYGPFQGDAELRRALSDYFRERGIAANEEDVLITSGSQQAIDLVARTFTGPGDTVYMEGPTYSGAIDVFAARGAANEPEHHRFRISYSYMDEKSLREAVILLCDVLRKYLANPLPKETHPWSTI